MADAAAIALVRHNQRLIKRSNSTSHPPHQMTKGSSYKKTKAASTVLIPSQHIAAVAEKAAEAIYATPIEELYTIEDDVSHSNNNHIMRCQSSSAIDLLHQTPTVKLPKKRNSAIMNHDLLITNI